MTLLQQAFDVRPLDIPIIDAHTHLGCHYGHGWHQNPKYTSTEALMEMYDTMGIDCCVTAPHPLIDGMGALANKICAREAEHFPGRVYGYIFVAPFEGIDVCRKSLETYSKNPAFVGLKFLGGYNGSYTDPVYEYAADFANEAGCPLLCHTWGNKPALQTMADMAEKRPNLSLLLAHQGGGTRRWTEEAAIFVKDIPNVYMELCGSLGNLLSFEDIRLLVGEDNMIFGTDAVNLDPRFDFGRLAFSTMSDDAKKKVFAGNFLKLLEKSQLGRIEL